MAKLSFLVGAAAGYVLGARAGRERYEQIRSGAQGLWRSRPVQRKVSSAKHAATTTAAPAVRDAVGSAVSAAGDKVRDQVTRGGGSEPTTGTDGPSTYPLGEGPAQQT